MKHLRKLRNAWVILLIIFSMLLSGCGQVANTPPDENESPVDSQTPPMEEEKDPLNVLCETEYIEVGFKFAHDSTIFYYADNIHSAYRANRLITDVNNASFTIYFGFDILYSTLEEIPHYKSGDLILCNDSGKSFVIGTTDGDFTSEKYLVDIEVDISAENQITHHYKYRYSEEIKINPDLFDKDTGVIDFYIVTDHPQAEYNEELVDKKAYLAEIWFYYKKLDDGKIILLTTGEHSTYLDWFRGRS